MAKMDTKRRYYDVGVKIEELLFSGVFKAGQRLPSERDLSERFETSRATIREAVIMLELKGLVVVRQGAGIYFIDSPQKEDKRTELANSDVGPFELLQARQIVESNVAGFAATQIKFNELRELKRVLQQLESEANGDSEKLEALDKQFHLLIAESTQNRVLVNQAIDIWSAVRTNNPLWRELNHQLLNEKNLKSKWLKGHKSILLALQKRSPEDAKQAVWQHIENCKLELMKVAKSDSNDTDLDDYFFAMDLEKI
jgi:GntR family uxuAB operon transcriptional repressor